MRIVRHAAFGLAALLVLAPKAFAASPRPWISGWLGGASYAMDDVNDYIGEINTSLAGSGFSMEDVKNGWNFGASLGVDLGHNFSVGLGYDRLEAMSDVGSGQYKYALKLPAHLFRGIGRYSFPSPGKANGFLELSVGRVSSAGSVDVASPGSPSETKGLDGSGISFEGSGGVDFEMGSQVDLFASLGYRAAKADDIKSEGKPLYDSSGNSVTIDWSGVVGRLGLTFAFSPRL